jgi:hypothetical protein
VVHFPITRSPDSVSVRTRARQSGRAIFVLLRLRRADLREGLRQPAKDRSPGPVRALKAAMYELGHFCLYTSGFMPRCASGLRQEAREPYRRWKDEEARSSRGNLLGCFPVEGVDFLGANVAQDERRIIRSQARPDVRQANVLQAEQPFKLAIGDPHTI